MARTQSAKGSTTWLESSFALCSPWYSVGSHRWTSVLPALRQRPNRPLEVRPIGSIQPQDLRSAGCTQDHEAEQPDSPSGTLSRVSRGPGGDPAARRNAGNRLPEAVEHLGAARRIYGFAGRRGLARNRQPRHGREFRSVTRHRAPQLHRGGHGGYGRRSRSSDLDRGAAGARAEGAGGWFSPPPKVREFSRARSRRHAPA